MSNHRWESGSIRCKNQGGQPGWDGNRLSGWICVAGMANTAGTAGTAKSTGSAEGIRFGTNMVARFCTVTEVGSRTGTGWREVIQQQQQCSPSASQKRKGMRQIYKLFHGLWPASHSYWSQCVSLLAMQKLQGTTHSQTLPQQKMQVRWGSLMVDAINLPQHLPEMTGHTIII